MMEEEGKLTIVQAVYLAGVAFSLGIRLGQIPMFDPDAVSPIEGVCLFFASVVMSFATSWLGAGVALGNS